MKLFSLILLLTATITFKCVANPQKKQSQLFLVGGGLKSCSSMAKNNCNSNALNAIRQLKTLKHNALYKIDKKTINLFKKLWPKQFELSIKDKLLALLEHAKQTPFEGEISLKKLKSRLKQYDQNNLIATLSDPEYYVLLDILEQPVLDPKTGQRIKEHVQLADSKNYFSTHIYQSFVQQARVNSGHAKPNIIVLTASARDPFEAADFYQAAFEQAGANALWLPLDATLNSLMQRQGKREIICRQLPATRLQIQGSVNREFVYPDLTQQQIDACLQPESLITAIKEADGIFINGGDQSLTLKAFIKEDGSDTNILSLIKEKLRNEYFIVGGTSAGTAVMSGGEYSGIATPMITNGDSNAAIVRGAQKDQLPIEGCQKSKRCDDDLLNVDLTYRSNGGLGLFKWGIMDTHFSERGRQGRLTRLLLDTNSAFAFGVDEATALVVSELYSASPTLQVIGQSGVFIVENDKKPAKNPSIKQHVITHYMTPDDIATIENSTLQLHIAPWKNLASEKASTSEQINNIFAGDRYQKASEILCRSKMSTINMQSQWQAHISELALSKTDKSTSGYGVLSINGIHKGYCSYSNYQLSIH